MRKTKEVLRLRFELGLGQRQIARSCGMGLATVHGYLERAVAAGIGWPLPEGLREEELESKLFGNQPVAVRAVRQRPQPDWKAIHEQLLQHRHLTLQLLWEEYRQANPEGYRYSWFCERYQHWRRHLDVVLRQEHKAGEKMFVDWAGATIPVYDATTGEARAASLFVSVLGASSYTYAEATRDQQMEAWIQAHIHGLEFFGGVPTLAVPDNTKTAVTRACRYDPDLNPTYQEFAVYYGMGVVPARPYKPRDKAKAESAVQVCERWIIAALRNRKFFSLPELNQAIRELLARLNERPFRKREHAHEQYVDAIEKQGEWYFPPIASLITGGAHLLLAMLERCITDKGGHYLFCDTDSMCIVASRNGGSVACPNEPTIKALSWKDVEEIAGRFESLNCYDRTKVRGSILKIEKVNFHAGKQIELFGFATSAKRYVLYRYDAKGNIVVVDAKAHGLGYLFPPQDAVGDPQSNWVLQGWHWVLEGEVATPRPAPEWFKFPAMMRTTVSTPAVLGLLKGFTKPFNFVHVPLLFPNLYPAGKDASNFGLIMPFSKHRSEWLKTKATDTHSGKQYSISLLDPKGRTKKIEVKCYGNILGAYREHPETKFLGSDGKPCDKLTRGLLRRSHIIASRQRYIGKETSQRWEQGDDPSMVDFHCAEYSDGKTVADQELRKRILEIGIRKTARASKTDSKTIMLISRGERVKPSTLAKILQFLGKREN